MWPNPQFSADLVTFTEKILNGKLYFLCSVVCEVLPSTGILKLKEKVINVTQSWYLTEKWLFGK